MALAFYRRSLERFDRPVLEQAWHKAAAECEFRIWPTCHSILKAAEHFHRISQKNQNPDAWVTEAAGMAEAYTRKFMKTTQAASRAREGGYERELKDYIWQNSWTQAQVVIGRKGLAYTGTVLFQNGENAEERQAWIDKAREQGATGSIRVHVPPALLRKWKEKAEKSGRSR